MDLLESVGGGDAVQLLCQTEFGSWLRLTDHECQALSEDPWKSILAEISAEQVLVGYRALQNLALDTLERLHPNETVTAGELALAFRLRETRRLRATIAWRHIFDASIDLDGVADRALDISRWALTQPPSRPLPKYFALLRRCYVFDFQPECIMIARSVLENALRETFAKAAQDPPPTMMKIISAAAANQWLKPDQANAAREVWVRGNKVIHNEPSEYADTGMLVEHVLRIVAELESVGQ